MTERGALPLNVAYFPSTVFTAVAIFIVLALAIDVKNQQ
jgi:hypothetical protein